MKPWAVRWLSGMLAGLIVWVGMVCWSFVLTGGWPPSDLLASASIGGMASPLVWALIRRIRGEPPAPRDELS